MKKWLPTALIASTLLGSGFMTTTASAQEKIPVYYKGKLMTFDVEPTSIGGRTMVEFRPLFTQFGYTDIEWDNASQVVTARKGGTVIQLQIGVNIAYVNGVAKTLDVVPQIVNGHTLVPLRFISDASGKSVQWNAETYTVTVSDTPDVTPSPSTAHTQSSSPYYPPLVSVSDLPAIITNKAQWDQAIYAHISNGEKSFSLIESFDPSEPNILEYSTSIFFKYGYGVWYSTSIMYDPSDNITPRPFTVTLDADNSDTSSQLAYSLQKAKEIDAQILTPSMTDLQKEKAINDYVVDHLDYDFTYKNHDAYQAITTGKTVCDGYSSLTNLLLDQAGIPNYIVVGQDHSWNEVFIQGQWYYLDTTWDDPVVSGGATADQIAQIKQDHKYDYFNRTDADITNGDKMREHTIADKSLYPATASTDLNPYNQGQ